jgi:ketosteroid isomerase-like protein
VGGVVAEARAVIAELVEAVNAHDLDAVAACFTADYVNETPAHPARGFVGSAQVRRNWEMILGGVPDLRAEVTDAAVDGDTVWTEWRMDGHRRDGAEHHMRGVIVFSVDDGAVSSARFYLEPLDTADADVTSVVARSVAAPDAGASR